MYNYNTTEEDQNYWISYTDLVTGFMIIFIIITLILFNRQADEITIDAKYEELTSVFEERFKNVEEIYVADDASIRFSSISGKFLFKPNDYTATKYFESLIDQFIPVYFQEIKKIYQDTSQGIAIKELRIEGHTDSSDDYLVNLKWSSARAQKVQSHILKSLKFDNLDPLLQEFIKKNSIAVGYSESRLLDSEGKLVEETGQDEDENKSRRVEFRILLEKKNKDEN